MPACLVIADDLTGANATGVQLSNLGFKSCTILDPDRINEKSLSSYDCILFPTDSRAIDQNEAYKRVLNAAHTFSSYDVTVYSKRIDSTLRGNLGTETDALLDMLGDDYIAISAPSFPSSGRIVVGGFLLVNGTPLQLTEASSDPKAPVDTSLLQKIFDKQTKYKTDSIYLNDVLGDEDKLVNTISTKVKNGARILCFDAITDQDLRKIARASLKTELPFICVDPGVFTSIVTDLTVEKKKTESLQSHILAVVGSVNPVACNQVREFWKAHPEAFNITIKTIKILSAPKDRKDEIEEIVFTALAAFQDHQIVTIVTDGIDPENRIDLKKYAENEGITIEEASEKINSAFAEIVDRIAKADLHLNGLYTSGGDITASVCNRCNAGGLELLGEILPLAAFGKLMNGDLSDLKIVTKGGMVGKIDAMTECIEFLEQKI